jgi:DNA-binding protein HU-beta
MTKAEFVELVQEKGGYESKAAAEKAIKAFTGAIEEALKKKETVTLVGFGTFSTVEVPKKSGKVPGTNKTYTKPAHTAPKFKFGKSIKEAVAK